MWIPVLKEELDEKITKRIPVLLTSEVFYKVLLNNKKKAKKAKEFYICSKDAGIPIPAEENKLGRPLIPFYRHYNYDLSKSEWKKYRNNIRRIIDTI